MSTKKKVVAAATILTLGLGFTVGFTPAYAHSDESLSKSTPISSVEKQEQSPFTGYIMSIGDKYMTVADTPTKEEAVQGDWRELVDQGKILIVPIPEDGTYVIGDRLNVYFKAMTMSLPPIAISPTIEKIVE
ncbi:DUF3221 domain-containing protein [Paenibacillus apiarius]|uniref:DUF3221 domain-containing protein n=1 Tax=Paenibacillus apiarius TaxID=46240 RepID=A0ABT4DX54_9BACL|nr:DUF3221 domain-containing protein [Paenibacillus apiarius]MCY9516831.1 DUF3221 domain-containing protein [Paenibacillus apiarius]MCY9521924.1 DUF3221 domain-containing protein [Paenibacillus apiarius]MCY9550470.1 DUF3221 domain-containing protein [Paenibacillus apiarius]MCY9559881.1 DUF3221 domain-containing protein [Paenibacillus apiarius]MCY9683435.1 DUF3221 domain-containing protein [Paenibacillus apiarius]